MGDRDEFNPCKCGNSDIEVQRVGKYYICQCTKCSTQIECEIKKNSNLFDVFEDLLDRWNEATDEAN